MDIREKWFTLTKEQKLNFIKGFNELLKASDMYFVRQRYLNHRRLLRRKGII